MASIARPTLTLIIAASLCIAVSSATQAGVQIPPADRSAAAPPTHDGLSSTHDRAATGADVPKVDGKASSSPAASGSPAALPDTIGGVGAETPGERTYYQTRDASILDPHNWALTAYKSRHQLIVYYKGRLFKIYHAVFGRSGDRGTKQWSGDRRTPEGLYVIVRKHRSRRWKWFLRLNYPNKLDRDRYEELRDHGIVPISNGRPVPEGGAIGIHGTDLPILNSGNVDWTTGCISVDNTAITELDRLLPIGTIVIIKP